MTMKWILKSINLYKYEYEAHELCNYEQVHEYESYDYESLSAVWTEFDKSMNLYKHEYETHDYEQGHEYESYHYD